MGRLIHGSNKIFYLFIYWLYGQTKVRLAQPLN